MVDDGQMYVKTCIDCGSNTSVVDSRLHDNGAIMRWRKCPKCGYRFKTIEIEECMSDLSELLNEIDSLKKELDKRNRMVEESKSALKRLVKIWEV